VNVTSLQFAQRLNKTSRRFKEQLNQCAYRLGVQEVVGAAENALRDNIET